MGKISRFGLMELSRQRLRPALNEGSHITCPRCNGTGVIRDVDSSALHILRILQEEAMKEGTAALHVQVPVEVATFLLNEKRTDIAKLEFRLKVTVVLIPNKHLETPNYSIERLKHDDPRLEDSRASYAMADEPTTETPYQQKKEEVAAKPRQEAVVKGITPTQPAPVSARPVEKAPQNKGLLSTIMGWFSGTEKKEAVAAPKGRESGERGERGGRGRGRGERQGRGPREDRGPREGSRDGSREGRDQRGRSDDRKDERNKDRPRREESRAEQGGDREPRKDRNERRPRQERGDRGAERAAEAPVQDAALIAAESNSTAESADQDRNGGGRRRRRRGRGGRRDESAEAAQGELLESTSESVASPPIESAPVAFAPASTARASEPVVMPVAAPAPVVTPIVVAVAEPVATPVMAPAVPAVSEENLKKSLDDVGLQWVQTDPNKSVAEAVAEPPPKLGRSPRKNTETAPQEPLVMVETRQNNP